MENGRKLSNSEISSLMSLDGSALNDLNKTLVSLLSEYSGLLMDICHKIDENHNYKQRLIFFSLILFCIFLFARTLFAELIDKSSFSKTTLFYLLLKPSPLFLGFLIILSSLASILFKQNHKLSLCRQDADILAVKIERLISVASQIEEHILTNIVYRIELDLKLASAESALRHYHDTYRRIFKRSGLQVFQPW